MRYLITGITGMDGSHMADLLWAKGQTVYGMERYKTAETRENIKHLENEINFVRGDLADSASIYKTLEVSDPDVIFNFAAQSFVGDSWQIAEYTSNVTGLGVVRLLEAIQNFNSKIKFIQASSSEMFGKQDVHIAKESTAFHPRSPYAVAKVFAHNMVRNYRESYGIFACSSICFNHESERRGHKFVTRKISDAVAKICTGKAEYLELGNLKAQRDWGYAPDYVEGIYKMSELIIPEDLVFATGETHSVEEFVRLAFEYVNLDYTQHIKINPQFYRPAEVDYLRGDASRAKELLGWEPKVRFPDLVAKMVNHDIQRLVLNDA